MQPLPEVASSFDHQDSLAPKDRCHASSPAPAAAGRGRRPGLLADKENPSTSAPSQSVTSAECSKTRWLQERQFKHRPLSSLGMRLPCSVAAGADNGFAAARDACRLEALDSTNWNPSASSRGRGGGGTCPPAGGGHPGEVNYSTGR